MQVNDQEIKIKLIFSVFFSTATSQIQDVQDDPVQLVDEELAIMELQGACAQVVNPENQLVDDELKRFEAAERAAEENADEEEQAINHEIQAACDQSDDVDEYVEKDSLIEINVVKKGKPCCINFDISY